MLLGIILPVFKSITTEIFKRQVESRTKGKKVQTADMFLSHLPSTQRFGSIQPTLCLFFRLDRPHEEGPMIPVIVSGDCHTGTGALNWPLLR